VGDGGRAGVCFGVTVGVISRVEVGAGDGGNVVGAGASVLVPNPVQAENKTATRMKMENLRIMPFHELSKRTCDSTVCVMASSRIPPPKSGCHA
jgi:hypothetical protein